MINDQVCSLSSSDLRDVERALAEEVVRCRHQVEVFRDELFDLRRDVAGHDGIDDGISRLDTDRSEADAQHAAQRLEAATDALDRLVAGSYGICADCGTPIVRERLLALPTAERCIRCQQAFRWTAEHA